MVERIRSGVRQLPNEYSKWAAENVSPERKAALRELGLGDTDEELNATLKTLETTFDMLPRGTMRFREMPNMKYRELAIRCQDVREHAEVIQVLERAGLFPWYSNENNELEIVLSHPSDLSIVDNLGLSDMYAPEQYAPRQRTGEPDVLRVLREKNEREPKPDVPLRPDPFASFPTPRSSEQMQAVGRGARRDTADSKERRTVPQRAETDEGTDIVEADAELRDIVARFDLGLTEADEEMALQAARRMPSLKLFPRKYVWEKKERKMYRARTGSEVTPGQQHRLNLHAKDDERAMRECVEMHIGLVLWCIPAILRKYPYMDPDDLFQTGLIGLMRALKNYGTDESEEERKKIQIEMQKRRKGKREDTDKVHEGWTTYMIYAIEQHMRRDAVAMSPLVKKTGTTMENRAAYFKGLSALKAAHPEQAVNRQELRQSLHRIGVLDSESDLALDRFERAFWLTGVFAQDSPGDLDAEAGFDTVDMNARPFFTDAETVEGSATTEQRREVIEKALSTLTEREELVIRLRFGLTRDGGYDADLSLDEVGEIFGRSRERIRQIEAKALRKLKHPFRGKRLLAAFSGDTLADQ